MTIEIHVCVCEREREMSPPRKRFYAQRDAVFEQFLFCFDPTLSEQSSFNSILAGF
jgi:hypothetical protein